MANHEKKTLGSKHQCSWRLQQQNRQLVWQCVVGGGPSKRKQRIFLIEQNLNIVPQAPLLKLKHLSTHFTVRLLFSSLFISFPSFIFPLFQTMTSHEKTLKPQKCFLLFLSLFPFLSLKLDEIDKSSSLNSLSHYVFENWLASTKKIRWYVLAESHYMFSILVAEFCVILRFGRVFLC